MVRHPHFMRPLGKVHVNQIPYFMAFKYKGIDFDNTAVILSKHPTKDIVYLGVVSPEAVDGKPFICEVSGYLTILDWL